MFERSRLFAESWNVAFREKRSHSILEDVETTFSVIKNSIRYWAADPFVFERNGEIYIFAELYDYVLCRGTIGYCKIENGIPSAWKQVIAEKYHLSFPYIYEEGSEVYIMAESSEAGVLYRYRATAFPNRWEKAEVIRADVKYADTILLRENNHCFALTYDVIDPQNPKLCWLDLADPENDCELNVDHQELRRPAGKAMQDEKIRCAQNCTGDYGKGLVFYQYIIEKDCYSEKEIKKVFPCDIRLSKKLYLDGMHTYNFSENYEVIDIKTRRFNLLNLFFRLYSKL